MQINLFNARNPNGKRVPVTVIVEQPDNVTTNDGEVIYVVSLHTGAVGLNGSTILPIYINGITESTFQEELKKALTSLGDQIDWGLLENDKKSPLITSLTPKNKETINIHEDVFITLKDPLPASYIDLSTLKLKINGVDVTGNATITEKDNNVTIHWQPYRKYT